MRDIKFRAWDNVKDRMYYCGEESDVCFEINSAGILGTDISGDFANFEELHHLKYMQYTGLKDKNGTEIYKGDIFDLRYAKNQAHRYAYVDFENAHFRMVERGYICPLHHLNFEKLEIIGNLFENPELLEEAR